MPADTAAEPVVAVAPEALRELVLNLLVTAGASRQSAGDVADHLVDANRSGHDSHGVLRVGFYLDMIESGALDPAATPRILAAKGSVGLVSGEWGFGQLGAIAATDLAVQLAQRHGAGVAGLVNCTHLGRMGAYVERSSESGVALLTFTGGFGKGHNAVPYGGAEGIFGANPIGAGFPTLGDPLLVDFATTRVAAGKVLMTAALGEQLEPGLVVDRNGQPTTNPEDFLAGGALLPFGEHKGYGLAVLCELLGQVLTGAELGPDSEQGGSIFHTSGALFIAIDIGAFRPAQDARAAAQMLADRLRSVPPAPGFARVVAPGDPESETRAARTARIEIPALTWQEIVAAAMRMDVCLPETSV